EGRRRCGDGMADAGSKRRRQSRGAIGTERGRKEPRMEGTKMQRLFRAPNVILFLLCLMYLITYIDRVNISTAAAPIQAEFKLTNTQLGLIFSAFAYPYALFQIIGGFVGDKLGPRLTLLICGLIWAGATIMTGLAGGLLS